MSSNMERVAAMPDASLYVNRDGRRADDCVDSHGGGNLIKIPRFRWRDPKIFLLQVFFPTFSGFNRAMGPRWMRVRRVAGAATLR